MNYIISVPVEVTRHASVDFRCTKCYAFSPWFSFASCFCNFLPS